MKRFRESLSTADNTALVGMYSTVALLHIVGFVVLIAFVVPHNFHLGGEHPIFSAGVGAVAYTFGLRHAFDADHIAAIDNTTRKLLSDRMKCGQERQPLSVGFWFALGHCTVVFGLSVVLALGVRALAGPIEDENSALHLITGTIGPSVSGIFLCTLGVLNLVVLVRIARSGRVAYREDLDGATFSKQFEMRGLVSRLLGGLMKAVSKPWHLYPIGVLFGLGFDTATEIGLLVLAGGAAAFELPFWAVLVLPVLFTAAMCLIDTTDGVFMNYAYGWAMTNPTRKLLYNFIVTAVSVSVSIGIGTVELAGVVAERLPDGYRPVAWVANVDLDYVGYVIAGVFSIAWLLGLAFWRLMQSKAREAETVSAATTSAAGVGMADQTS